MNVQAEVVSLLDEVLGLKGRGKDFRAETRLLGALPELDSMAVVGLITALEERFGVTVDDDEIDGDVFLTVASLTRFVADKVEALSG